MKICWDNLEKLRYSKKTGKWYKKANAYIYHETCVVCEEPFLSQINNDGFYYSHSCKCKHWHTIGLLNNKGRSNPAWKDGLRANDPNGYNRRWKKENPEKISKANKKYKRANLSAMYALNAQYRAKKLNQTCPNANQKIICWFYEISRQMSKRMGAIGYYHVDHIIPLSKNGLHHEDNLQILTAHQNQTKRNKIISQNGATP